MLIAKCGNFNAACTTDAQCAYNSCNNGLCNGFIASSKPANATAMSPTPSAPAGNATVHPTGATPTSTRAVQFTGAAAVANVASGAFAMVVGAVAMAL